MPSILKIKANWTTCTKDRDCFVVPDCCGWEYGFKYAINEWSAMEYERYRSDYCQPKDHRKGCGWSTPKVSQAKCQDGRCRLYYGGFTTDDLQDENFTIKTEWMRMLDK